MTDRRRAWFGAPLVLLLLVLAVAGCAAGRAVAGEAGGGQPGSAGGNVVTPDPGSGGGSGDDPGGGDEPVGGMPGATDPGDGALRVKPQPDIVNAVPHQFDRITVSPDGRTLTVYYYGGVEACYGLASVDVRRAAGEPLVVTILEGTRRSAQHAACIDIALLKAVTVTLDEPLVVAGAVDAAE